MESTFLWNMMFWAAILGLIPAFIARAKGHPFFLYWVGGALLFIVALPVAIFIKPDQAVLDRRRLEKGERRCSECQQFISVHANICPYCRREQPASRSPGSQSIGQPVDAVMDELTKLAKLHQEGSLSDEEFKTLKAKLIKPGVVGDLLQQQQRELNPKAF